MCVYWYILHIQNSTNTNVIEKHVKITPPNPDFLRPLCFTGNNRNSQAFNEHKNGRSRNTAIHCYMFRHCLVWMTYPASDRKLPSQIKTADTDTLHLKHPKTRCNLQSNTVFHTWIAKIPAPVRPLTEYFFLLNCVHKNYISSVHSVKHLQKLHSGLFEMLRY